MPSSPVERYLPPLTEKSRRWLRFIGLIAAVWVLAYVALWLRQVLTPLVVAMAIAYILNPLVTYFEEQRGISRIVSVSVGLGIIVLIAAVLTFAAVIQLIALADDIPTYAQQFVTWVNTQFPKIVGALDAAELTRMAKEHGVAVGGRLFGFATATLSNVGYALTVVVLVPLYTFFFLVQFNEIVRTVRDHLPADYRPNIIRIAKTIDTAVSAFFRGRVVVCAIVGVLSGIGWLIVGINHSLLLGAAVAVLNLVPFLSIAVLPAAVVIAYVGVPADASWALPVMGAMAVYLAVQAIESFILTPTIESRSSGLHPVTTVIALLIGGQTAGLLGMLLAIPIASTLKSLAAEYILPEVRRLAQPAAAKGATPEAPEEPAQPTTRTEPTEPDKTEQPT